jgi:hypothetical protein
MISRIRLLSFIIAGFLLAGCSPTPAPSQRQTSTTPTIMTFPIATFVNGEWELEFKGNGTFAFTGPSEKDAGRYTSEAGSQVTLTSKNCGDARGTYLWHYDQQFLILKAIDDSCKDRSELLTSASWVIHP